MRKITINIEGMHCASCVTNIGKSLKKVKGVKNAQANLMIKKAYVESDDNIDEKALKKAVERVGNYKVKSFEYEDAKSSEHMDMEEHKNHGKEEGGKHQAHDHGTADDKEISSWKKKMVWSWLITIPIIFFMFSESLFGLELFPNKFWMTITILVLAFPVIFIFGFQTLKGGLKGYITRYFNMDSLISLGTVVAFSTGILSLFTTIQDFSGISSMIMTFFITGKFIEAQQRGKAGQEIKKLLELGAKKARVIRNNKEIEIPISEVKINDVMLIKPGEKIPTDGIVVKGESAVDESMVTGESLPTEMKKGSNVIGATINQDGVLYIKATKIGKDTFLSHIIKLVEEAQGTKVPIQALADKVTNIFVPIVLVITVLTFIGWWYFTRDISRTIGVAVSVLVIACPCALGLATPTALMVGSGMGAKRGILIRKGEAIQTMKEVKTIIFDKTGTITKGHPEVTDIYNKTTKEYLLDIAGSLEKLSEHPLSKAIVKKANLKKPRKVSSFKIHRGKGVEGKIGSKKIVIGNRLLMKENKISIEPIKKKLNELESQGKTVMIVSENKKVIGLIAVADAIKDDSKKAIKKLKEQGYKTIMITGDNVNTAKAIAKQVGIDDVIANVLPKDKALKVKELKKEGMVAFVGDGVNDAPALKEANVGIAMGGGTDIAIEAGDLILTKNSLIGVTESINLSKATFKKIKQNLFFAFFYNIIAIPIAVAGFLNPAIAEIAMALSSVTVVTNANLLRRARI